MTDLIYENGGIYRPDGTPYRGPTGRIPVSPLSAEAGQIYRWAGDGQYRPDRKDADVTSSEHEVRIRVVPVVDADMMSEAIAALEELRTGIKKMADAFAEAVRVLEDGDTAADDEDVRRCPSCQHGQDIHDVDGRCWYTVGSGVDGANLVCQCIVRPDMSGEPVQPFTPDEMRDTDTWTVSRETVRILCHDVSHGWGGTHHHAFTSDDGQHHICPGY